MLDAMVRREEVRRSSGVPDERRTSSCASPAG